MRVSLRSLFAANRAGHQRVEMARKAGLIRQ